MKRIIALMLAVLMVFAFASCTKTDVPNDENAKTPTDETQNQKNDGKKDEVKKDADFKVGVIHIGNPSDGAGYTFAHDQGIVGMQKNLNLLDEQIVRKNNVPDTDAAATKTAIEECIEEGCNIIFGTSWGYMDTMESLAKEYPNVIFSHGTGYKSNDKNFNNYFGRIYQARYLSGIVAGLKTISGKIGFVAAMDSTNAEVTGGIDAFAKGVAAVNPTAEVYVKVTGSWFDPTLEGQTAEALLDLGCDVIGQHCDTTAPQLAAQNRNVWGCGYNSDMTKEAPKAHLTAPIWNWEVYYTAATKAAMEGKWKEFGNYYGGMAEGFVDVSPLSANCADGTKKIVDAIKALIIDGSFGVFDGKQVSINGSEVTLVDEALIDNEGKEVVAAGGKCLEDSVITGGINWYYKNVKLA